jgi:AcrB/AcrD/AcrF family
MEDQVTYPIVTSMLGAPNVKAVRGFSDFGYSYVYIVFEDGTDIYWVRSRTLEYLSGVLQRLPQGVTTELGPDATGVGWVFNTPWLTRAAHRVSPSCVPCRINRRGVVNERVIQERRSEPSWPESCHRSVDRGKFGQGISGSTIPTARRRRCFSTTQRASLDLWGAQLHLAVFRASMV